LAKLAGVTEHSHYSLLLLYLFGMKDWGLVIVRRVPKEGQ
jgi:hypothetical protein